jgi:hypothetical protein
MGSRSSFRHLIFAALWACAGVSFLASGPAAAQAIGEKCAEEGSVCFVPPGQSGIVTYGARGLFTQQRVTGNIPCSNQAFGTDPLPGARKSCHLLLDGPGTARCADEGGICFVPPGQTGVVTFGARGLFARLRVNSSIPCTNDAFGGDPIRGVQKACYLALDGTPAAVYVPPPVVAPPPVAVYAPPPTPAEVFVEAAPPPVREEIRPPPPGRGFEWIPGYWRWEGRRHVWVNGYWERPRPGYHWVAHHWENRGGRWVFIEGGWRP